MGIATILGYILQAVQAGFVLSEIVANVRAMEAKGATEADVHAYLKKLANDSQAELEKA